MNRSGRSVAGTLFLLIALFLSGFAREQITFYSQSRAAVLKNENSTKQKFPPTRELFFLTGDYEILKTEASSVIGKISVPSVFHTEESFVFRRTFTVPADKNAVYFLHFEKMVGLVELYLNDELLFQGEPSYLAGKIPLSSTLLRADENELVIHLKGWDGVDSNFPSWFPINLPRIDNGIGGLIFIEKAPSLYISNFSFGPAGMVSRDSISGEVVIVSPSNGLVNAELEFRYSDPVSGPQILRQVIPDDSLNRLHRIGFFLRPDSIPLWTMQNPQLFTLQVTLLKDGEQVDQYKYSAGFRTVRFEKNRLILNERPIVVKGVNYVYQDLNGVAMFDHDLVLQDLLNIQSGGFNAVRVGYFPQSSDFYRLTDSLGILCFQDLNLPLLSTGSFRDSLKVARMLKHIEIFQRMARQHPSVVGIGLNNFTMDENLYGSAVLEQLREFVSADQQWIAFVNEFRQNGFYSQVDVVRLLELLDRDLSGELVTKAGEAAMKAPTFLSGRSMPLGGDRDTLTISSDLTALLALREEFQRKKMGDVFSGDFLLDYQDYFLQMPSLQVGNNDGENFTLNPRGLYTIERELKPRSRKALKERQIQSISRMHLKKPKIEAYLFLIIGIINFFIFLFIYRAFVDFRKNISRSIRRPHGFFVELLERRLVSNEQSFYLLLLISVNAAVMLGGIIYFFKTNLMLDYVLSLLVIDVNTKYYLSQIIWKPYYLLPVMAVSVMIVFYLFAIPVQMIAFLSGSRIRWRQALATSTWAASPYLLLIPFGLFFYNLMAVLNSYWILGAILLYFHVWYILRWLNGTRVMAVSSYTRVFVFTLLFLMTGLTGLYFAFYRHIDIIFHIKVISQLFHFYA